MTSPIVIIIFIAVVILSLMVVGFVNQQQTRARIVAQKLVLLRRKVSETEEIASVISTLVASTGVLKALYEECIERLNIIEKLDKDNHICAPRILSLEQQVEELDDPGFEQTIYRAQPSDAAIARAQHAIKEAAIILRKRQAADKIDIVEMETLIGELSWTNIAVEAVTHIVEGHKCVNKSNVLKAYAFYKKALEVLMQASINDARKHKMVKQLDEMMANKRKHISTDLMPEDQHNPDKDSADLTPPMYS